MNPRQRRAILLLGLSALALIAVFVLVASYVADVRAEVDPKVTVLELAKPVKANASVTDDDVREVAMPRRWAPASALRERSELVGLVAGTDLTAHSILQQGMLQAPPQLAPGQREVAILVDAETGVAGKVRPNDLVDILATFPAVQDQRPPRAQVVVPGVRVIDVGQPRVKGGNGVQDAPQDPTQVVPVTFALTPRQQLLVTYAESFAQEVRLGLLRPGERSDLTPAQRVYAGGDPTAADAGQ